MNCLMSSVDVYAREDDKLTENWITLDFVHWLKVRVCNIPYVRTVLPRLPTICYLSSW